jgi:hypothetical protein
VSGFRTLHRYACVLIPVDGEPVWVYIDPSYAMRLLDEHPERVAYLLEQRVFHVEVLVDALRRIGDGETDDRVPSRRAGSADTTHSPSSPLASARCSATSPKDSQTAQSPVACSSPNARWRDTYNRSFSSSGSP